MFFFLEISKNNIHNPRIFHAGDDPDDATAGPEVLDVNVEHPLQAMSPGHGVPVSYGTARVVGKSTAQRNDHFRSHSCPSLRIRVGQELAELHRLHQRQAMALPGI